MLLKALYSLQVQGVGPHKWQQLKCEQRVGTAALWQQVIQTAAMEEGNVAANRARRSLPGWQRERRAQKTKRALLCTLCCIYSAALLLMKRIIVWRKLPWLSDSTFLDPPPQTNASYSWQERATRWEWCSGTVTLTTLVAWAALAGESIQRVHMQPRAAVQGSHRNAGATSRTAGGEFGGGSALLGVTHPPQPVPQCALPLPQPAQLNTAPPAGPRAPVSLPSAPRLLPCSKGLEALAA